MKKLRLKYIVMSLLVCSFTACDFIDCDESSDYEKEDMLTSYNRMKQMATNVYSYLPNGFCNIDGAMQEAATDDAVHVYRTSQIQRFTDGTWGANSVVDDVWSHYYEGIRAANLYLRDAEGLTFDEWKYNDNYEAWMKSFEYYKHEVRFLRAYYYFELIRRYNNVPLIDKVLTPQEANFVKPSSFETVARFILSECDDLKINKLPDNFNDGFMDKETGRITRGAAMALASRLRLYLASPLHSADNQERWKEAATAAYELISQSTELGYGLGNYADLFDENNNKQKENILVRPVGDTGSFEQSNFPMGVQGGKTSTCPTENLVSAYETTGGAPFDWSNETMRKNPYANRDPRLAMTIAYNEMVWPAKALQIWEGGTNGLPLNNATVTGYYLKKYVNNDISFESGATVTKRNHNWILFRYGEILLNYAEAMANAFSPGYSDLQFPLSALDAVNLIRKRSDVDMPVYPADISKTDFIKRLKNERRVELAFEGHRFWDVRRWKELDQTADIYSVQIKKNATETTYERKLYGERVVLDCMYFYPIANTERFKNENLIQNTGW